MKRVNQEQSATYYVLGEEGLPAEKVDESPFRAPDFGREVVAVFWLATAAGLIIGTGIQFDMIALSLAGFIALVALIATYLVYLREVNRTKRPRVRYQEVQTELPTSPPPGYTIRKGGGSPVTVPRMRPEKTVPLGALKDDPGSYTFSGYQLEELNIMLEQSEDGDLWLKRDDSPTGPGLRNIGINNNAGEVIDLLVDAGFAVKVGQGVRLTETGKWWLRAY